MVALEAVEVGFGAAGRNAGFVNAGMWVMPSAVPKALGPDYGERAMTLLDGGPAAVWALIDKHAIACDPVPNGTLKCAVGKARARRDRGARRTARRPRRAGPACFAAGETAARARTAAYAGALFDARAGTIQPLAYARGLARAAIGSRRDDPHPRPVRAAERTNGAWTLGPTRVRSQPTR